MKKRILIVDDDQDTLKCYKETVDFIGHYKQREFETITANSKADAEKYLKEKFDYAILDGLNGDCFELYDQISAEKKIIISGDLDIVDKCKKKGLEFYLKPISLLDLEIFK